MKEYNLFMKGWLQFWNWVKALFSASDDASIKRFVGFIFGICLMVITFLVAKEKISLEVWDKIQGWCEVVLYVMSALLGIGAIVDGAKIVRGWKSEDKKPEEGK